MTNTHARKWPWLLIAVCLALPCSRLRAQPAQDDNEATAPAATLPSFLRAEELPEAGGDRVDRWIAFLTGRNAERTRLWLERSGRYAPYIRSQLQARGMPEDLVYLAMIESGFSPKAHSAASAAGIWQFIAETGRRYGLRIDSYLDERRDPIASTNAALSYLQKLYDRFGSWYLAAAAYNTGENRVERILRERAGGRRGSDALYWKIAPYLPRETRDYVPLMLAAERVARAPESFGFTGLRYHAPLAFDSVKVSGRTSLQSVAQARGFALAEVVDLNPHLPRGTTPPNREWIVRVPRSTNTALAAQPRPTPRVAEQPGMPRLAGVPVEQPTVPTRTVVTRHHRVLSGESLWSIARRYDVTVNRLRSLNGLGNRSRIYAGQQLRVW